MTPKEKTMLEYLYTEGNPNAPIKVRLDGKYCGDIKPLAHGWVYYPKGNKEHGEIFKTIQEVQDSLSD